MEYIIIGVVCFITGGVLGSFSGSGVVKKRVEKCGLSGRKMIIDDGIYIVQYVGEKQIEWERE